MKIHLLSAIAFGSLSSVGAADPYAADVPAGMIDVHIEYVEMKVEDVTALLQGDDVPGSGLEWNTRLKALLEAKTGTVVGSVSVVTKSGQRATCESVLEQIYATEYSPASGRAQSTPEVPAGLTGVDVPTASTFEMRPAGVRLEVDPILGSDGKTIDLNLAPELVRHLGKEAITAVPQEAGDLALQQMPRFFSMKTQTSVTLISGGTALIGLHTPPTDEGELAGEMRVLCFVTARVVAP